MDTNKSGVVEHANSQKKEEGGEKNTPDITYIDFLIQSIKKTDSVLSPESKGYHTYGLINIVVFSVLVMINSLVGRLILVNRYDWDFGSIFNYLSRGISYLIAIAILLAAFKHFANKQGNHYDLNFFMEKLGAMLVVPSILIICSIPLEIIDITIHSWISSLAFTFLYLSVFMISYLFVARNNLQTASLFIIGFYLGYRLIYYIF
ncbi:hypothetical protein ACFSTA_10365 [Ornithinibacillus salinisoli]|uniref:Yip1 domain-containing protein n=1 Tax=Ornithinibacillus salinisoli TaxID=1848459 RepID=A0ABW4W0A7_9BACI